MPSRSEAGDYNCQRDKGQTIHVLINNKSLDKALIARRKGHPGLYGKLLREDRPRGVINASFYENRSA